MSGDLRSGVAGVIDLLGLPAARTGGGDVFFKVIKEENVAGSETGLFLEGAVDGGVGLMSCTM